MLTIKNPQKLIRKALLTGMVITSIFSSIASAATFNSNQRNLIDQLEATGRLHINNIRNQNGGTSGAFSDPTGSVYHVNTRTGHSNHFQRFTDIVNIIQRLNDRRERLTNDNDIARIGNLVRTLNVELAEAIERDRRVITFQYRRDDSPRNEGVFQRIADMLTSRIHGERIRGDGFVLTGAVLAVGHTCVNAASSTSYSTVSAAFAAGAVCAGLGDNFLRNHWRSAQDARGIANNNRFDRSNLAIAHAERHMREVSERITRLRHLNNEVIELITRSGGTTAQQQRAAMNETYSRITRAADSAATDLRILREEERQNDNV